MSQTEQDNKYKGLESYLPKYKQTVKEKDGKEVSCVTIIGGRVSGRVRNLLCACGSKIKFKKCCWLGM